MTEEPEKQELAAHAFDLLEGASRARVEGHLRTCDTCAEQLSEYRAVIAALPYALNTAVAPSESWEKVAARIRRRDETKTRLGTSARWRPERWPGLRRVLQPALFVALVATVIGLIAWNSSLQVRLSHRQSPFAALANGSNETVVVLFGQSVNGVGGHLIMSEDRHEGGLVVAGLPALASGRSYQIWFVRPDQSRAPAGTFRVDGLGQALAVVAVPQPARDFDGVAITEEPDGGRASPTGHDLLAGPIYEQ